MNKKNKIENEVRNHLFFLIALTLVLVIVSLFSIYISERLYSLERQVRIRDQDLEAMLLENLEFLTYQDFLSEKMLSSLNRLNTYMGLESQPQLNATLFNYFETLENASNETLENFENFSRCLAEKNIDSFSVASIITYGKGIEGVELEYYSKEDLKKIGVIRATKDKIEYLFVGCGVVAYRDADRKLIVDLKTGVGFG